MSEEDDLVAEVRKDEAVRVRTILERNPFLLRIRSPEGTLVLTAQYYGARDALKLLLERTPEDALNLYEAAAVGNARRLKTILGQSRALVNEPNHDGFTPLGLAAFFGHPDAVKVLLEFGAMADQRDKSRFANTALDAAVAGDHANVVRILLGAGASANVRSAGGYTPLHKAAMNGDAEIATLLLDNGADVRAKSDDGRTPLACAIEKGHAHVADLLRARGASA